MLRWYRVKVFVFCKIGFTVAMRNLLSKQKIPVDAKKTKTRVSLAMTVSSSIGVTRIENHLVPVKKSYEHIVAELADVNRISFNIITSNKQMRWALLARR